MTTWVIVSYDVIYNKKNIYRVGLPSEKNIYNISNEDSPMRILFLIAFISFLIVTISNILYLID